MLNYNTCYTYLHLHILLSMQNASRVQRENIISEMRKQRLWILQKELTYNFMRHVDYKYCWVCRSLVKIIEALCIAEIQIDE